MSLLLFVLSGAQCSTPGLPSPDTPAASPNTCKDDRDCVLALRIDVCCSCPEITTQARLQTTPGLVEYIPGRDYGSLRPAMCARVNCSPCPPHPAGALCTSGECRSPETPEEILTACPGCFLQAAQASHRSGDLRQAVNFCTRATDEQQSMCFSELFYAALTSHRLDEAEQVCRLYLHQDIGGCLRPIALKWAQSDDQYAIQLCNEIEPTDARHVGCIRDIALAVSSRDQNRALEICTQLSARDAELCRQDVLK